MSTRLFIIAQLAAAGIIGVLAFQLPDAAASLQHAAEVTRAAGQQLQQAEQLPRPDRSPVPGPVALASSKRTADFIWPCVKRTSTPKAWSNSATHSQCRRQLERDGVGAR